MSDSSSHQIRQILLKPDAAVVLSDDLGELTEDYMQVLGETLTEQALNISLDYVRPMSGGTHVLRIEPALSVEQSKRLTEILTDRDDVEYAEPDLPRRR